MTNQNAGHSNADASIFSRYTVGFSFGSSFLVCVLGVRLADAGTSVWLLSLRHITWRPDMRPRVPTCMYACAQSGGIVPAVTDGLSVRLVLADGRGAHGLRTRSRFCLCGCADSGNERIVANCFYFSSQVPSGRMLAIRGRFYIPTATEHNVSLFLFLFSFFPSSSPPAAMFLRLWRRRWSACLLR